MNYTKQTKGGEREHIWQQPAPLQPPPSLGQLPSPQARGVSAVPAGLPRFAALPGWGTAMCFILLVMLMGILMVLPNKDAADTAKYCDMVWRGAWPDYRSTYDQECIKGKVRPAGQKSSPRRTSRVLT